MFDIILDKNKMNIINYNTIHFDLMFILFRILSNVSCHFLN